MNDYRDTVIDDVLQFVDPARTPADSEPSDETMAAAIAITARRADPPPARTQRSNTRSRSLVPWTLAATFVVVATVVGIWQWWAPPTAAALTPAPLQLTSTSQTVEETVEHASQLLRAGTSIPEPIRLSTQTGWYAQIGMVDEGGSAVISPENRVARWNEDLSGTVVTRAGVPYWANDSDAPIPTDPQVPSPGTMILDFTFAAGEFPIRDASIPGTSKAQLLTQLNAHASAEDPNGAGDYMEGITGLLEAWTLTNEQEAMLLQILHDEGGMTVAGTGTDRAGRPIIALRATSAFFPRWDYQLLVSTETGRIVGLETIQTATIPNSPIQPGSIVGYTLWDVENQ